MAFSVGLLLNPLRGEKFRGGMGGRAPLFSIDWRHEKKQLSHRYPPEYIHHILTAFNAGNMSAAEAGEALQIGPSQLYHLRHEWLRHHRTWPGRVSGGARGTHWPSEVLSFIEGFLPHCQPLNYSLIAEEVTRRFGFKRSPAAVGLLIRRQWPDYGGMLRRGPKPRRRWQCGSIGELWQHDSSPHAWWPDQGRQNLVLTIDDHSRRLMAGRFIPVDTTWDHFCHFRQGFDRHGIPVCVYTDGLSLFGHESAVGPEDVHSNFQRALTCLNIGHRVAPDPQAKGKIERRFGFFQKRLVSLLALENITTYQAANAFLADQIDYHNQHFVCRTTGLTPNQAWDLADTENRSLMRPTPKPVLMDLHLAHHLPRRLNPDHSIDFLGRNWPVAPCQRKYVTVVYHPRVKFWVVAHPPNPSNPVWPDILACYSL